MRGVFIPETAHFMTFCFLTSKIIVFLDRIYEDTLVPLLLLSLRVRIKLSIF